MSESQRTELAIVTVLYGGAEVLESTLPSWVRATAELPVSFVFIDNSDDDSAARVVHSQTWAPGTMHYDRSDRNVGFAAGANRAIERATAQAVLLLNADVTIDRDHVIQLLALEQSSRPRAISLVTDGKVTAGVEVNAVGWFSDRPVASPRPCLGASGGAALLDRADFLARGGFTDALFAWGEDAALALRTWTDGLGAQVVDLRLPHVGGHSVATLTGLRRKALWLARNRVWIMRAQYSLPYRATFGMLMLGMMVLNGARKVTSGTGRAYFRGMAAGLTSRPPWKVEERMTIKTHLSYLRGTTSGSRAVDRMRSSKEQAA